MLINLQGQSITPPLNITSIEIPTTADGILITFDRNVTINLNTFNIANFQCKFSNYTGEYQYAIWNPSLFAIQGGSTPSQPTADSLFLPMHKFHFPSTAQGLLDVQIKYTKSMNLAENVLGLNSFNWTSATNNSTLNQWTPLLMRGVVDWGVHLIWYPSSVGSPINNWIGALGNIGYSAPSPSNRPTKQTTGIQFSSAGNVYLRAQVNNSPSGDFSLNANDPNFYLSLVQSTSGNVASDSVGLFFGDNSDLAPATKIGIRPINFQTRFRAGGNEAPTYLDNDIDYLSLTSDGTTNRIGSNSVGSETFTVGSDTTNFQFLVLGSNLSLENSYVLYWIYSKYWQDNTTENNWKTYYAGVNNSSLQI